jgi:hypothetical protein
MTAARALALFGGPALLGLVNLAHPAVSPPIYPGILAHLPWRVRLHAAQPGALPAFCAGRLAAPPGGSQGGPRAAGGAAHHRRRADRRILDQPDHPGSGSLRIDRMGGGDARRRCRVHGSRSPPAAGGGCPARPRRDRLRPDPALPGTRLDDIQPVWWLVTIATAAAMAAARPRAAPALLVLAGALFGASHVSPTGPMGGACFLVAAGLIELGGVRARLSDGGPPGAPVSRTGNPALSSSP